MAHIQTTSDVAIIKSGFPLLARMVVDPNFELSLGAFGAVGQFPREARIFVDVTDDRVSAATESSSISLRRHDHLRLVAFETLSSDPEGWNCGIAICLPEEQARMSAPGRPAEDCLDRHAIFAAHRTRTVLDIVARSPYADIRLRADKGVLPDLRDRSHGSVLDADLVEIEDCIWIFETAVGRIETGDRRRRHFLSQLFGTTDTHSRTLPIPEGLVPVGYAFPPNPRQAEPGAWGAAHFSFQVILDEHGVPELVKLKRRVERALEDGKSNEVFGSLLEHSGPPTRMEIECVRIALRQRRWLRGGRPAHGWEDEFDAPLAKTRGGTMAGEMVNQPTTMKDEN